MKSILILCATVLVLSAVSCGNPGLPATTEQEDTLSVDSVVADTDTVVVIDSLG